MTVQPTPAKQPPKYRRIFETLRGRMAGSDLPPGSVLPSEDVLCAEYGVSRHTLRQALALLERQGLIERRRRAGTRVLKRPSEGIYRQAIGVQSDLLDFIRDTRLVFDGPRPVQTDRALARLLGCDELRSWQLFQGSRTDAEGRPVGLVDLYIDPALAEFDPHTDFGGRPIYQWMESRFGFSAEVVSHDITAVNLSKTEADKLGERPGAASLQVVRRYFDRQQRIFLISVTRYRSADFGYHLQILLAPGEAP